jgi:diaminohydroxyphosphoribosylaminopyrimidine deaminase/5-amino-6-(5-phosphoribosylamino)uracil reductase
MTRDWLLLDCPTATAAEAALAAVGGAALALAGGRVLARLAVSPERASCVRARLGAGAETHPSDLRMYRFDPASGACRHPDGGPPVPAPAPAAAIREALAAGDAFWMSRALALARTALGRTAPNPAVGCVLVKDGELIAEGATADGGAPHAEEQALSRAGAGARGADAFVTLEPCRERSRGETSCADRLLAAGLTRVVYACADPHPRGEGGARRLEDAGMQVARGVGQAEAAALNAGFFKRVRTGRPLVLAAASPSGFEAEFALEAHETPEQALDRLGAAGLSRIRVRPESPLAALLQARGLLDHATSG